MFSNLRFTPAITFVFHAFLSLFVGALASGLAAAGLAISQPNVNLNIVIGAGVAAFSAWFVHGLVSLRNSPQLAQAEKDALTEAQARLTQLETNHAGLVGDVRTIYQQVVALSQAPTPVAVSSAHPVTLSAPAPLYAPNVASTATTQVPFPPTGAVNYAVGLNFGTASIPAVTPAQ